MPAKQGSFVSHPPCVFIGRKDFKFELIFLRDQTEGNIFAQYVAL